MPLYLDVHELVGQVGLEDVARAHRAARAAGDGPAADVRYLKCWIDEEEAKIFCLVDAPTVQTAVSVHREAHARLEEGSGAATPRGAALSPARRQRPGPA